MIASLLFCARFYSEARMASAIRAASRAVRTSWTRTICAPLRMAAVVAARVALARTAMGASVPE